MSEFALYHGVEVVKLLREDSSYNLWLVEFIEEPMLLTTTGKFNKLLWIPTNNLTFLDPALNILFERKDDGQKTTTNGRRRT